MKKEKELTQSLEKYLLAVYEIVKSNSAARVKDISSHLQIGMPATSDAIKALASKGYINYVPYGIITLTPKGKKKALNKIKRHKIISDFLENVLIVDSKLIEKNTQAIEYSLGEDVLEKFVQFLTFMEKCSCKKPKWKRSYEYYAQNNEMSGNCAVCSASIEECDKKCACGGCGN